MSVATAFSVDRFSSAAEAEFAAVPCRPVTPGEAPRRLRSVRSPEADPLASVSVLHPPAGASVAMPVRLTRRGVLVLALALAAVCGGLVWLAALSAPAPAASPGAHAPHAVTVESGDTLWSIASRVAPQRDPRAEVAALQRRNHLRTDAAITPGQTILVP